MGRSRKYPGYKFLLAGMDWLVVVAAFGIALALRGKLFIGEAIYAQSPFAAEAGFVAAFGVITVLVFRHFHLYKSNVFITLVDHTINVVKSLVCVVMGLALVAFFIRASWVVDSRLALAYFALCATGLFILVRVICFRKVFMWLARQKILHTNVLIVGAGATGKNLAVNLLWHNFGGQEVVGFLDDELPIGSTVFNGARVVGRVAELAQWVSLRSVQEVIVCLEKADYTALMGVVEAAVRTKVLVKVASPLYEVVPARLFVERYGTVPVVSVRQSGPGTMNEAYKKVFDTVIATIGVVVLSPVFAVIGALIKLDSPGPVLYRQVRIGRNGCPFNFFKFRSMTVGSDLDETRKLRVKQFIRAKHKTNGNGAETKIVNEARVTRVGKWLRRFSLDELPQLLNVLKGEMSMVGPRPCLPYEWDHYEEWHKRRLSVLPGCTGMWQVSGRSVVGFDDMVVLDLYYIQNSSPYLDLRLLVKTIPVLLLGSGGK